MRYKRRRTIDGQPVPCRHHKVAPDSLYYDSSRDAPWSWKASVGRLLPGRADFAALFLLVRRVARLGRATVHGFRQLPHAVARLGKFLFPFRYSYWLTLLLIGAGMIGWNIVPALVHTRVPFSTDSWDRSVVYETIGLLPAVLAVNFLLERIVVNRVARHKIERAIELVFVLGNPVMLFMTLVFRPAVLLAGRVLCGRNYQPNWLQ